MENKMIPNEQKKWFKEEKIEIYAINRIENSEF